MSLRSAWPNTSSWGWFSTKWKELPPLWRHLCKSHEFNGFNYFENQCQSILESKQLTARSPNTLTLSYRHPSVIMGYFIPSNVYIFCLITSPAPSYPLVPFGYVFTKWDFPRELQYHLYLVMHKRWPFKFSPFAKITSPMTAKSKEKCTF